MHLFPCIKKCWYCLLVKLLDKLLITNKTICPSSSTQSDKTISMGLCKKDITPLLMHWSYVFLALTHRYDTFHNHGHVVYTYGVWWWIKTNKILKLHFKETFESGKVVMPSFDIATIHVWFMHLFCISSLSPGRFEQNFSTFEANFGD